MELAGPARLRLASNFWVGESPLRAAFASSLRPVIDLLKALDHGVDVRLAVGPESQ